jgi:serine/threonine protein kinase
VRGSGECSNPHLDWEIVEKMSKRKLRDQYEYVDKPIGEGAYGVVYKAYDLKNKRHVAIKRIRMNEEENDGIPPTALREIALLKELSHPRLVQLLDIDHTLNKFYLCFEWVEQDLKRFIEDSNMTSVKKSSTKSKNSSQAVVIDRFVVRKIMYQLLEGIDYCHSHMVFHRD